MVNIFKISIKEFKNLKSVTIAAMLLALHTVMSLTLSIQVTESLKLSLSFIANCITAYFFGPVVAFVCGALGDIVQFIIKPTGPYFAGWTINAALACLVYGIAFYNKAPKETKESVKTYKKELKIVSAAVLLCAAAVWFFTDFASVSVTNKETGEIFIYKGNAIDIIKQYFTHTDTGRLSNMCVMAIMSGIVIILLFIANFAGFNALNAVISMLASCIMLLSAYTDRKYSDVFFGFIAIAAVFLIFSLIKTAESCYINNFDGAFIIREIITFSIVNLFVNAILGTYWVSMTTGNAYKISFFPRLIKNIIQIPINTVLTYIVFNYVKKLKKFV